MALNKLPPLDKSRFSSKTETENTDKLDTKKTLPLASSEDKHMEAQKPTERTTKTDKLARDDRIVLTMSVSLYRDLIPRKKKKINHQKLQSQQIK